MRISTILPGQPMASIAARHVLARLGDRLAEAVLLLPTRRACSLMRQALVAELDGQTILLPRILPLGDLEQELPGLLPPERLDALAAIPPAMPEWQRLSLLMKQVIAFEQYLQPGVDTSFSHALGLAQDLAGLQDLFVRAGQPLTMEALRGVDIPAHYAQHWESSLQFLSIVAASWPDLEREEGSIIASARQMQLAILVAETWEAAPPAMPVFAIGSTASQPVTARLLRAVAHAPQGEVILPGLDPSVAPERWQCVAAGHPLFHLKSFLDGLPMQPAEVALLDGQEPSATAALWLAALECNDQVAHWRDWPPPGAPDAIRILPCAHGEEEARVLALLIREGLELGKRTALITPDEGLMQRVGAHLARYGIVPDRLKQGTLAATETGSLWLALLRFLDDPARVLPLLSLLRHPLLVPQWQSWLTAAEPAFRGLVQHGPGQLPRLAPELRDAPEYTAASAFVRHLHALARRRFSVSEWLEHLGALAGMGGEGAEAVAEALDGLRGADLLGPIDLEAFAALVNEALADDWRGGIHEGHPGIAMLTPVEARLQRFDRVLLANMQDQHWPGLARPSAWLNLAQQQALGLPGAEEHASLMAHDLLLLGSQAELFLTYPEREQGSPATRSRFIERLAAFLAVHGIAERALHAPHYLAWAHALYAAPAYEPASPPRPCPPASRRPQAMAASALDYLTTDPYTLYARYVLGLRELDPLDAEPEARELGTLVHEAMRLLGDYWNQHGQPADEAALDRILQQALAPFAARAEARLFWHQRLSRTLAYVNEREGERRLASPHVAVEAPITRPLDLGDSTLTLHGRMDRLETGPQGARIGDYKTGEAPKPKAVMEGQALQLLAYALLLEIEGEPIGGIDYWELPAGRRPGTIHAIEGEALREADLLARLHETLTQFMDPATPLLARPTGASERFTNPYDGLTRYDEWAG